LTRRSQIVIVERFREYSVRVVRETRHTVGRRKAHATQSRLLLQAGNGDLRYTEYKRFTVEQSWFLNQIWQVYGPSQSCLRHPPPWMGYAGRNSETESAPPESLGKDARSPSTVYVWLVVPLHRRNSREGLRSETLQRSHSFCVYGRKQSETLLRVSHEFRNTVLRALTKEF
jgi:hypothetical protein